MAERRERVVLELVDDFSPQMARAAAATAILNRELRGLDGESVETSRSLDKTEASTRRVDMSARRAEPAVRRLGTSMDRNGNGFTRATGHLEAFADRLGTIPALSLAAGAALVPLGAAAAGVGAALGAPIVFGGGALTLFGFLDAAAISKTNKQLQNIDALKKKLAGLKQGTAEYTKTTRQLFAAQHALTPAQRDYAASLDHLKATFADFLGGKTGEELLEPIASALTLAARLLPQTEPVIAATSGALSGLLDELNAYSQTPEFERFVHDMARQVGPDLTAFGHVVGDITPGIGHLLLLLGRRLSPELLGELSHLGREFSDWADSREARQGVEDFIAYVHKVGPDVASSIGAVARGLAHVTSALAPLGPPVLKGVEDAANAIAKIPTPVLTGLAAATIGLTGFSKLGGFKAAGALGRLGGSRTGGSLLGGVIGSAKPVPVFVTNEGFGGPGRGPGGTSVFGTAAKLIIPAAIVAEAAKLGFDKGASESAVWQKFGADSLLGYVKAQVAAQIQAAGGPRTTQDVHVGPVNLTIPVASKSLASTTTAFDAMKAHAQAASRQIDQIGPHAQASFATASSAVSSFQQRLDAIHDKKFQIIADDQAAIRSLEALQALTIRDKSFNVIENHIERNVGPGGGMQRHALGGYITGPGGPTSDSIPARLSNGEFVMRAAAVQHYGLGFMHAVNGYAGGGPVGSTAVGLGVVNLTAFGHNLHDLNAALSADTKALDDHRQHLHSLVAAEQQMAQSIAQNLRPQLFGQQTSIWGQTTSPQAVLTASIASNMRFGHALNRLNAKGLNKGLLAQLAQSGDLQSAQMLAGENRGQLAHLNDLYRRNQQITRHIGTVAADRRYGDEIAGVRQEIRSEKAEVVRLRQEVVRLRKEGPKTAVAAVDRFARNQNRRARAAARRATKTWA